MNIEVTKAMIESLGHKTDSALNGNRALQTIKERLDLVKKGQAEMYKVILLDYSMPDIDGPQVAQRIK